MKVTIKDENNIPKLMKNLKQLKGSTIKVGVPDGDKADIAAVHEFGATITAKKKYLAIPLQRKYKGRSPKEFSDLFFVPSKNGNGGTLCKTKGKGKVEACYWLTKSVKIPERSFLRACIDFNQKYNSYVSSLIIATKEIFAEKQIDNWLESHNDPDPMLNALGLQFRGYVQKYIRDLSSPANAPLTKAVKGSGNPLIDQGHLVGSIEYEIK